MTEIVDEIEALLGLVRSDSYCGTIEAKTGLEQILNKMSGRMDAYGRREDLCSDIVAILPRIRAYIKNPTDWFAFKRSLVTQVRWVRSNDDGYHGPSFWPKNSPYDSRQTQ